MWDIARLGTARARLSESVTESARSFSTRSGRRRLRNIETISYARARVESRSKDGNFHRVETAYAAGMGLV
jgi:hypothetical protein